jgi:hypothetical protein
VLRLIRCTQAKQKLRRIEEGTKVVMDSYSTGMTPDVPVEKGVLAKDLMAERSLLT